ncbi:hypothetical protein C8Q80DRAFT_358765 [Daedaleopsis nitida]|nr:hypothetical protein C8Q80DRAFT_358765 [Daedaleopsis nitida]
MQHLEVTPREVLELHATIHDLPLELLADIISIVVVAASDSDRTVSTRLLPLRLVCRDWNALACSTASLWTNIHASLTVPLEWLLLCLERSGQAPLDILFFYLPQEMVEGLVPLLSQPVHLHRIRILRIEWTDACPALLALYHLAMPSLERLEMSILLWPSQHEHSIPMSFPRLHTLKLAGVSILKDPAIYTHLRSLALHHFCCPNHQLTLTDLIAVLKAIHRLETLDLSEFSPCNISASELRDADASVRLPYLRKYTIHSTTPVLSSVNRLLSFPMTCTVKVTIADPRDRTSRATISDALAPCIRRMLENAVALIVCSEDRRFHIRVPAGSEGTRAPPQVEIYHREGAVWMPSPRFGDFVPFCPSDRLTRLTFSSISRTYSVPKWAAVLRAYPTLQNITITYAYCDVSRMISALTPLGPGHPEDRQELLCPDLRSIRVELYTRTNKVLHSVGRALVTCATARAERGARRLESLTVIWSTRMKAVLPEGPVWEDVVGRLRVLVDEVDISAQSTLVRSD